jgi:non-ribosomal peptide synthetase component F
MTNILSLGSNTDLGAASSRNIEDTDISVTMHLPGSSSTGGFTFASILKAAWAIVLARHRSTKDVIFGHVVTTPGLARSATEYFVGPCMEFMPVRVDVSRHVGSSRVGDGIEDNASVILVAQSRDVLEQVQSQQIEGMPHHTLGFSSIVSDCNDWPAATRISTFVQHRNAEEQLPELILRQGLTSTRSVHPRLFGSCDLWILTTLLANEDIDITMSYCD